LLNFNISIYFCIVFYCIFANHINLDYVLWQRKLNSQEKQLESLISLIETIEGMYGCSEDESDGFPDFDIEARKEIKT
jgi:hypothetical protein